MAPLYGARLAASFDKAGVRATSITVPAGESSKEFGAFGRLMNDLLDRRPDRKTTLVALGGGVVGDLAGFAAAVLLRGVDFIQVPTTLLAQVDSSVGGKTGINTRHGKNLVGAFYQPRLVLADTDVLDTLPKRELLAGYAEVAKYGLIDEPEFFAWCEKNGAAVLAGDAAKRTYAIEQSCLAKARIVAADERETTDLRALLNLGHTFGHALEAETGFGPDLLHGEAVGAGMAMAFDLSARLGLCPADDAVRVRRHLGAVGLPVRLRSIGGDNRRQLGRRTPDRPHARRQEGRGRQAHLHPGARHRQGLRESRGRREGACAACSTTPSPPDAAWKPTSISICRSRSPARWSCSA